ncbi:GNAT family N-acetyltransferase [Streptomyces tanashiensis]|uniref:GNAT family N-acetyltransferase n=1 Tax=Streptomyces tanashiensis TaxID=67367 RepID=A0ABY6QV83_9ACTN|nr:GNAT family N-acetyltransferase [Streptomyces tanashiensis]UZX21703.1 GNAT family N-acetyltransferase [Streptomyces tanashiensis]
MDIGTITKAWVAGWTASRGTPSAVTEPWGYRIDVGLPRHVVRHVLPAPDAASVGALCARLTAPYSWLKVMAGPEEVEPWITEGWTVPDDPGFMMVKALDPGARPAPPEGYARTTEVQDGVVRVRILAPDGALAARGQIAPTGSTAVADQIETDPAHRRRGLGANVMRTLEAAAAQAGATTGVLAATTDGRALYDSLGWHYRGPLTGIVRTGPEDD